MNVFIIPSWYPSSSNPVYGIFNKEQAEMLADNRPNWSIAVSTWGQGDERFMLRALDWRSFGKAFKKYASKDIKPRDNLTTYFTPAFTWTRKFKRGNIDGIIRANRKNLDRFISNGGKPDIISVHAAYPGAIVAEHLSRLYNIPFVVTAHMSPFPFDEFLSGGNMKPLIKEPLIKANALVATSRSLQNRMQSLGLSKTHMIPNPVNISYFTLETGVKSTKQVILSIGRIEEQKGIDMLLNAFSSLKEKENIELRIGGDGAKLPEYKRLAETLDIGNKVKWLGELERSEVLNEMQSCSFFALTSRHETFGIVLLEAMACGKPILATSCGGPEDIVTKEVGLLCEPNLASIKNGLSEMLSKWNSFDPHRIRMEAENRFSAQKWSDQIENLFKSVIEK